MKRKQLWYLFLKYFAASNESILIHVQVQIFLTEKNTVQKKKKSQTNQNNSNNKINNNKKASHIYVSVSNKLKTFPLGKCCLFLLQQSNM